MKVLKQWCYVYGSTSIDGWDKVLQDIGRRHGALVFELRSWLQARVRVSIGVCGRVDGVVSY
jgi:hypothetical protein